jgi:hypothetical protein
MSEPTAKEIDDLMAELEAELDGLDDGPKPTEPQPAPSDEHSDLDVDPPGQGAATPELKPAPAPAPVAARSEPVASPPVVAAAPAASEPDADELAALEAELRETEPAPAPAPKPTPAAPTLAESAKKLAEAQVTVIEAVKAADKPKPAPIHDSGFSEAEIADPVGAPKKAALNYYVDVEAFKRETAVSDTNLDDCMIKQSGLRAYYGAQAAHAEAQHARLKVRFDVLEAKLYDTHRKRLAETGEKVTEKAVENAVKLDPQWLKAKNAVIEAETIANVNRSLVVSLSDRKDMLVQLGADRREEFKGQLRMAGGSDEVATRKAESLAAKALAAAQRAQV